MGNKKTAESRKRRRSIKLIRKKSGKLLHEFKKLKKKKLEAQAPSLTTIQSDPLLYETEISTEVKTEISAPPPTFILLLPESLPGSELVIENGIHAASHINPISGRRMVNISHLFKRIKDEIHPNGCTFMDMHFIKEHRRGLHSSFLFKCTKCGTLSWIESEKRNEKDRETLPINTALADGCISSGLTYIKMKKFMQAVDIPVMSQSTYIKNKRILEDVMKEVKCDTTEASEDSERDSVTENVYIEETPLTIKNEL